MRIFAKRYSSTAICELRMRMRIAEISLIKMRMRMRRYSSNFPHSQSLRIFAEILRQLSRCRRRCEWTIYRWQTSQFVFQRRNHLCRIHYLGFNDNILFYSLYYTEIGGFPTFGRKIPWSSWRVGGDGRSTNRPYSRKESDAIRRSEYTKPADIEVRSFFQGALLNRRLPLSTKFLNLAHSWAHASNLVRRCSVSLSALYGRSKLAFYGDFALRHLATSHGVIRVQTCGRPRKLQTTFEITLLNTYPA